MIELKDVTKRYGQEDGLLAVDGVTLSIGDGAIFGIIGYSGAGKSTLIRLLNGLEKPTSGSITIAGREISSVSAKELRKVRQKVSMIFQHFNLLWSRTVKGNIAFPLEIAGVPKAERERRVEELIDLVGLRGRENAHPAELSGGQKQRVGIARALANEPEVLLCDEATSALDPETTDQILDLLTDINQRLGLTIVMITHEMHVIRKICHQVAVMESGRVVEKGNVLDVFQHPQAVITKRFVSQVTEPAGTEQALAHVRQEVPDGTLVKLVFIGERTEQPVLSSLIRSFQVDVNIVQGNITHTQGGAYGTLILQILGNGSVVQEAIQFLQREGVQAEVIVHD
ncbi:D-methionine transport system ATP-binding protein [Sporosarcina luteola]|nr:D-methionine transport system ATP-binding protein [Sporosarcina luteola]